MQLEIAALAVVLAWVLIEESDNGSCNSNCSGNSNDGGNSTE